MTSSGDDQNPYKPPVEPPVSIERRKRPLTHVEVAIGVVLAIIAGGITFVATCWGLGFLAFVALDPRPGMEPAIVGVCALIGIVASIASACFAVIRWNRSRKG